MKQLSLICLLLLTGCSEKTSLLHENEKALVGNWKKNANNGQVQGWYMEFHEDRTGIFGPVIKVNGKTGLAPYLSMMMKEWKVQNDTLSIEMAIQPGLAFYGPDGKKIEGNGKPSYAHYIIREMSDSAIVLKNLIGEIPGIKDDRLKKSEKLELLGN